MQSLRNGADCLNEVVQRHTDATEQAKRAREAEKAAKARRQELVQILPPFPTSQLTSVPGPPCLRR